MQEFLLTRGEIKSIHMDYYIYLFRFDLDPGSYLLVPYTYCSAQKGRYFVRILGELDDKTGPKTGW